MNREDETVANTIPFTFDELASYLTTVEAIDQTGRTQVEIALAMTRDPVTRQNLTLTSKMRQQQTEKLAAIYRLLRALSPLEANVRIMIAQHARPAAMPSFLARVRRRISSLGRKLSWRS